MVLLSVSVSAQPSWTFDPFGKEKKPKEFEEKVLGSEKTADKKFTFFRKVTQNNISHYNYYFNANAKLNMVVDMARSSMDDDYTRLLPFYPYKLDHTSSQQNELDSVIYKCTAGILLHDLRTNWVDNMYLLIGRAYYFRKVFDSAAMTFQFINYNLFPRKKNENDNRIVGANSTATSRKLSIADREKRNIIQRTFTLPPSRNDALIWLARTYVESDKYGEAAGLINILQEDPNLPKRLKDDLNAVTAYWYFKQEAYDSAAAYLEKGLSSAETPADKYRWHFLLGQLFEISNQFDKAGTYYDLAAKHTVMPLMDIYARLNKAKMLRNSGDTVELNKSIATLLGMAGKDKFESYRDIIFHSVGLLDLKKYDTASALTYFKKSLAVNTNNASYKNKSHLAIGRIAYVQRQYKMAADHYDSLDINEPSVKPDSAEIADRKVVLRKLATQLDIIQLEDSLQMIAAMPPTERDAFLKKLSRKLKKEAGSKEEPEPDAGSGGSTLNSFDSKNAPVDLFSNSSKGDWYFYNASLKSKGFGEFKSKWGKRDNVDNWRRKAAMTASAGMMGSGGGADPMAPQPDQAETGKPLENSYDALSQNIPLTPEKLDSSNAAIATALLKLAGIFQNELQDYQQAIYTYEIYLQRFPDKLADGEVYLGLYYCYNKIGDTEKANHFKELLNQQFASSKSAKMLSDPLSLQPDKDNPDASRQYGHIYDLFISGSFDEAFKLKKAADSINGNKYWSPQLLYIEALYYVKCSQDSEAIHTLQQLVKLYPKSPLADKSNTLIDVLGRRKQIESYLMKLDVKRAEEDDKVLITENRNIAPVKPEAAKPSAPRLAPIQNVRPRMDSAIQLPPSMVSGDYKWKPEKPHMVVMLLDKVDGVYVNEAKNAYLRFNTANRIGNIALSQDNLEAQRNMLIFSSFESAEAAMLYLDKVKKAAPTQVSWLQPSKYYFFPIDAENLQILKSGKNLDNYKKLLNNQYPGKF